MEACIVTVTKAQGVKCPRCWKITGEGRLNFDGLCDGCCDVLVQDYPEHEAVPFISQAYGVQRQQWAN